MIKTGIKIKPKTVRKKRFNIFYETKKQIAFL